MHLHKSFDFPPEKKVILSVGLSSFVCRLYAEDAGEAVRLCEALLEEPELDPAVRVGDAFGFLVEHHCQQGNFQVVTIVFRLYLGGLK